MSAAGVPVELTVDGDQTSLPPGAELAAYRVVQEALTKVLKHSVGGSAHVHVGYSPSAGSPTTAGGSRQVRPGWASGSGPPCRWEGARERPRPAGRRRGAGLRLVLQSEPDIEVVGEASDGVQAAKRIQPDVALIDLRMPRLYGLVATRAILRECPSTKVVEALLDPLVARGGERTSGAF